MNDLLSNCKCFLSSANSFRIIVIDSIPYTNIPFTSACDYVTIKFTKYTLYKNKTNYN